MAACLPSTYKGLSPRTNQAHTKTKTSKQTNKITAVSVFKACALDHIILLGLTFNFNLTFLNIYNLCLTTVLLVGETYKKKKGEGT